MTEVEKIEERDSADIPISDFAVRAVAALAEDTGLKAAVRRLWRKLCG